MTAETLLFWPFALLTVVSACGVVAARSPISSAMSLVSAFFFLAGIYVLLWAHTIAIIQVLVYAGAIMVLFLFVIMLLSLTESSQRGHFTGGKLLGGAAAFGLFGALLTAIFRMAARRPVTPDPNVFGTLAELGRRIYTDYLFPFEAVSLLLLVAIVGAVVVAKPRI